MKRYSLLAALALLIVFSGCVRMTVRKSTMKTFPSVPGDQVVVYNQIEEVPEGYVKVAVIHVQDALVHDSRARVLGKIKAKAGTLGANGIVLGTENAPTVPAEFSEDPENYHELPQPVEGADPATQDAWMDVLAVRVKTSN